MTSTTAHIVGNGPSWTMFESKPGDFVLGCNIPKVKCDATLLSDMRLAYKIREKIAKIDCPVIANTRIYNWLQTPKGQTANIEVYSTYERPEGLQPMDMSSGHFAILWLIEHGYKEIHVWGCDCMFDDHIWSHTDDIVHHAGKHEPKHNKKVAKRWRENFHKIRDENKDREIIFHGNTSTE